LKSKYNFNFRLNHQIRYPEVRVLGEDGKQVGIMSSNEALAKAMDAGLDLVEIAPMAKPPVVRIVELGKFKYEQEKRERQQKKSSKSGELKEIRFSPFIGDHDFDTRIERIKEFLDDSFKVRIVVVFKGRQMGSKQFGYEIIGKVLQALEGKVQQDGEPKFLGKHLMTVISPVKGKKTAEQNEDSESSVTKEESQ
jgi:translation initiation factor IF-3